MPRSELLKSKILLLEDDYTLSSIIEEFLSENEFDVTCVYDGNSAIDTGYESSFDLLLLDVKVPNQNGFEVLKKLRSKHRNTPAIFITSLDTLEDLSNAYNAGCDDYLRKPFELKELELRIHALLKRNSSYTEIDVKEGTTFDPRSGRLICDGEEIILSRKEAKILKTLLRQPENLISSAELIEAAWDYNEEASEESLRTHIKNLRKILGKETIINIRGQGYQIAQS